MEKLEFGIYDDPTFTVKYPLGWENMSSIVKLRLSESIFAYGDVPRRKGFFGKIADVISRKPLAGVGTVKLPLDVFKGVTDRSTVDQVIFKSLGDYAGGKDVSIIAQEKKKFKGKDSYFLSIDATVPNGRLRYNYLLVVVNENFGIALNYWVKREILDQYNETFERVVESFEIK